MACISFILLILVISLMRKNVGLKPEEYSKNDLYGSELEHDNK